MFTYVENSSGRTIASLRDCQQNYSYCYYQINHYGYPVPTWQNYYPSYNNFVLPFSPTNCSIPDYVPQYLPCTQYQCYSNSNGHSDGCFRLRRDNIYSSGSNHRCKGKCLHLDFRRIS